MNTHKLAATVCTFALMMTGAVNVSYAQSPDADATASSLTTHLKERGFTKCMDKIDEVTNFVINSGQHSAIVYFDEEKGDKNIVSFLMGREGGGVSYLASIDFTQNESCSASYEITRLWVDSCDKVVPAAYAEYKDPKPLNGGFSVLSKSEGLHLVVRALPGNSGCLTVQKEMLF